MSKVKIIDKKSEKSILDERDLLSKLKHPFIVNMLCAFQDYENLYLLMDLLTGGDLRYHYNSNHIFSETEIRFFISCLILSLEYIHENNIIHRDVKPENLVCDEKGYVRLTDFGIAKVKKDENNSETSGTPGYMAPEVLLGQNHSFPVDFYAIGIIGYEFLMGKRPYVGKNRKEIKQLVLSKEAYIDNNIDNKEKIWSNECIDFINRCLKRKVNNRLGYHFGIKELKTHPWFAKYDWLNLYNKKMIAPYIPKKGKNFDIKYCESYDKISNSTFERYKGYMRKNDYMKIFEGYTYFYNDLPSNTVENETVTRVSTSTKGNKQELCENQSFINIHSSINNEKNYSITPLKNIIESSISYNKGLNSVENKMTILDKKKDDNKNIENYQYHVNSNMVNSLIMMKMEQKKRNLNKKQISADILNINKNIKEDINNVNNKITENNYNNSNHNNSSMKKDSLDFKNDCSSNFYLVDNNNVNINNIINIKINNDVNNVNISDKNVVNNINNLNEINLFNKIRKRNNSKSSLVEKKIQLNNDYLGQLRKNINNSVIDFRKFKRKKLNIHSLCGGMQNKELNIEENKNENKILPIYLPPLNKVNINKNNNNNSNNYSQNSPLLLSNIKHFKFKINKKKRIKNINFNQNKIIENINKTNEEQQKPYIKFFSKCPHINNIRINNDNNTNNNNNYNDNNYDNNIDNVDNININEKNEKKSEIYKKMINNEKMKSVRIHLGKSQSTELFPKIKIT